MMDVERLPRQTNGFRLRGTEVSRLEAFSDGLFALAMTLLIVNLSPARTFAELRESFFALPVFAVCFVLIGAIWWEHHRFFRRTGLQDWQIIVLNGVLMFLVMFYVYPLKFLFSLALNRGQFGVGMSGNDGRWLFTMYGAGMISIYGVLGFMHRHALACRDQLQFDEREAWMEREVMQNCAIYAFVGIISISLAWILPENKLGWAGMAYALLGLFCAVHGSWMGNRRPQV
ncbi:MAG: TMEM175 family protein [Planctomycetes bacterium]|nr:TMEM175 family protein [Planctomycetota bacterium]